MDAADLDAYLATICQTPPLSKRQEYDLWRRSVRGNTAARNKLLEAVLPWIVRLVKPYARRQKMFGLLELINIGNLAALESIEHRFNPARGRLTTFVAAPVQVSIIRYLRKYRQGITLPERSFSDKTQGYIDRIHCVGLHIDGELREVAGNEPDPADVVQRQDVIAVGMARYRGLQYVLTKRQRQIFDLFLAGHNLSDIARMFGTSRANTQLLFSNGVKRIQYEDRRKK